MFAPLLAVSLVAAVPSPAPKGHLVIVGGGRMPPAVLARALDLAGGPDANVLVIPDASRLSGAGERGLQMWQQAGARHVSVLDHHDRDAALAQVRKADLIWMSGGNQLRLMQSLEQLGLVEAIRERFQEGATVGGTSAGAAVMSQIMLTRARAADGTFTYIEVSGLGLWPDVIVDQHFLRRHRLPRLLHAVEHHPDKPGIGIDESTAVVVDGHHFEVIGTSSVLVLDARHGTPAPAAKGRAALAAPAEFVLKPGAKFDLDAEGRPATAGPGQLVTP